MKGKALIMTSVASMIEQFNMPNIELLQNMGYEVHAGCNFERGNTCSKESIERLKKSLRERGVEYYQIDFTRNIWNLPEHKKAFQQVKKIVKNHKYRFIHCQSPIGGVAGRIIGKEAGVKVIYTAHGFHFYKGGPLKNWIFYYPIEKYLSRYTDTLITVNREDFERAKKKLSAGQVEYIPGIGIDIEKIKAIKADKRAKRKELGIPEDAILLLSVGELNGNKNHKIVIEAMGRLKNPNLYYVICGQGKKEKYLERLAGKYQLGGRVKTTGFRKDVTELMKTADIFVHPSKREGLSVALMEALACGSVCIASRIRGNTDLIEDKRNGFLFSLQKKDDLRRIIGYLLENPEERKKAGKEAMEGIKACDKRQVMQKMQEIYREQAY